MSSDFELIHGQLFVSNTKAGGRKPECLGRHASTIRGTAYIQGPMQVGHDKAFCPCGSASEDVEIVNCAQPEGNVMIGHCTNPESPEPYIPNVEICGTEHNPYSLVVKHDPTKRLSGGALIFNFCDVYGELNVKRNVYAEGEVVSNCGAHVLSAKKNFDIPHPSKQGWRLRHTCLEGPENAVYHRGRVTGKKEIDLPEFWKNFVDKNTITVSLTPIGAHQDVIVKRWDDEKIYLQSKGGMPIDCFYHIFAERSDGERLIVEYEGETPADYPGNSYEYSVSGWDYDQKEA